MEECSSIAVPGWQLSTHSVRGASHQAAGQINQDAAIQWSNVADGRPATLAMVAVADGHGSECNFRSDRGSRLAVETLKWACETVSSVPEQLLVAASAEGGKPFASLLVRRWREQVEKDLADRPLTEAELAAIPDEQADERARVADDPIIAYGSTLIGVVAINGQLIYVQIGDGDLYALTEGDSAPRRPFGGPDDADGEVTDSLCTRDAAADVRVRVTPAGSALPDLIFLSTDGYSKSYAEAAAFEGVVADIHARIKSAGFAAVAEKLPDWLAVISKQGSSDDISVGMLYRSPPAAADGTATGP